MAGFIYFIPKANGGGPDILRAAGLFDRVGEPSPEWRQLGRGPDGNRGVLVRRPDAAAGELRYRKAEQIWSEGPEAVAGSGGKAAVAGSDKGAAYWLGYGKAAKPKPKDLARPEQVGGHYVVLEDGNRWMIPVGFLFLSQSAPVTKMRLRADGKWERGEAVPGLAGLAADAKRIWSEVQLGLLAFEAGDGKHPLVVTVPEEELCEIAARALAVNYSVGPTEVAALEILTSKNVDAVARAIVDWPTIEEMIGLKKKQTGSP